MRKKSGSVRCCCLGVLILVLTPILATRPGSWTLEKLARVFLNSYALRRLAGLSRLMSGREEDPLAWAREA